MNPDANGAPSLAPLLEAREITKRYTEVPVLKGVSFALQSGEIVGLVGHNGAGKSTLLKVFSGAHKPSTGTILIGGLPVDFSSPSDAISKGISTVYQELSLLPNLTVAQNVWLGREKRSLLGLKSREMRDAAYELISEFGLDLDVDRKVGRYPVGTRQLLEIAIAASRDTRCLLLDEPTTALEGEQVAELLAYLKSLSKRRDIGIILVDHKLDELYSVCDRIVALTDGSVVIDAPTNEVDRDAVVAAIAGTNVQASDRSNTELSPERDPFFRACHLSNETLKDVSFSAARGRILGIYGLGGSGRSETLRAMAGIDRIESGEIAIGSVTFQPSTPVRSIKHKIAFVTEERKTDGIVPQMNSLMNAGLPILERFTKLGFLNRKKLEAFTSQLLENLHLKGDARASISSLSGGNQQKVLLARALAQEPTVLLLDEPTKGVDIGVKAEIHSLLRTLAHEAQLVVIMVSSEEDEILDVSDEILVFADGRPVTDCLPSNELDVPTLRQLAWGTPAQH